LGYEAKKSCPELLPLRKILGGPHAIFLPEREFLGFSLRIRYFKWKSSILARK